MSHQTYFGNIPRDINEMTLYYLPPEELGKACESNDEFQSICHDSRFLENYAKEKLLLSPQVNQTHFLPRAERFKLLGEIGYDPLISFVLDHEKDVDTTDIVHIGIGAAMKGHENVVNWSLELRALTKMDLMKMDLISMLVNAAIEGGHPELAERILIMVHSNILRGHIGYAISKELGKKNYYEVFRRLLRDLPKDPRLFFGMFFIAGALAAGNLRYFNGSLTSEYQKEIDREHVRNDYDATMIRGAVESENSEILNYVLEQLRAHNPDTTKDYSTILNVLPISNPLIWNLSKQEYHPYIVDKWAFVMGLENRTQMFDEMMREFSPSSTIVNSFIRGLAQGGHFQTIFSLLDRTNWPKDIYYTIILEEIASRDDVESFIRLLQGLKEHGISIGTPEEIMSILENRSRTVLFAQQQILSPRAKDILKWMTIHGMIPLTA